MVSKTWMSMGWIHLRYGCSSWPFEGIAMVPRNGLSMGPMDLHERSTKWSAGCVEMVP